MWPGEFASEPLRANADHRLAGMTLGRVEGGNGFVEGRNLADIGPQSSVPHPLDDLGKLGAIGLDDEVDRQAVGRANIRRCDDRYKRAACADQRCRPLLDCGSLETPH